MKLPLQTKILIEETLSMLKLDREHNLRVSVRFRLYLSFDKMTTFLQPSIPSSEIFTYKSQSIFPDSNVASLAVSWLSIITAKKVLPIWEKYNFNLPYKVEGTPSQILAIAEGLLNNKVELNKAKQEYYGSFNIGRDEVTYDVICVYNAALSALGVVLHGVDNLSDDNLFIDNKVTLVYGDFASEAVKAYSSIDSYKPGKWIDAYYKEQISNLELYSNSEDIDLEGVKLFFGENTTIEPNDMFKNEEGQIDARFTTEDSVIFDAQKRLEFWEWWLTEAIPLAWELAQQTYKL